MLQNAYFLAKLGADTAENEQHFAEILPKTGNYHTGPKGQDLDQDQTALSARSTAWPSAPAPPPRPRAPPPRFGRSASGSE